MKKSKRFLSCFPIISVLLFLDFAYNQSIVSLSKDHSWQRKRKILAPLGATSSEILSYDGCSYLWGYSYLQAILPPQWVGLSHVSEPRFFERIIGLFLHLSSRFLVVLLSSINSLGIWSALSDSSCFGFRWCHLRTYFHLLLMQVFSISGVFLSHFSEKPLLLCSSSVGFLFHSISPFEYRIERFLGPFTRIFHPCRLLAQSSKRSKIPARL